MLKHLPALVSLDLLCPACCGLDPFALSSTHPHLRAFSLQSVLLRNTLQQGEPPTKRFFKRHPKLECLTLSYDVDPAAQPFPDGVFELDTGDLPNLRALSVTSRTFNTIPTLKNALSKRPLQAVQVDFLPKPDEELSKWGRSIKYLHINTYMHTWRNSNDKAASYAALFATLPSLVEFRLTAESGSTSPPPEPLAGADLVCSA